MQHAEPTVPERVIRVGRVTGCANGEIEVTLESGGCGSCSGGCGFACGVKSVGGLPAAGHRIGDRVLLSIDRRPVRRSLRVAFGAPLAGLLFGAAAANFWVTGQPAVAIGGDGLVVAGAGIGLILGVLVGRWSLGRVGRYPIGVAGAPGDVQPSLTVVPD